MSKLGDFLEAVYGIPDRFATVRATVRYWREELYAAVASDNHAAQMAARTGHAVPQTQQGYWTPDSGPRVYEAEVGVWLAGRDRGREEVRPISGTHWGPQVVIVNGVRSWFDTAGVIRRRTAHREAGCLSRADRHFGRHFIRQLFQSLDLEEIGTVEVAGHECIRLRAVPIPEHHLWSHWFPHGGQEYELHVDPERAAILAIIARVEEGVFETNEVIAVAYDDPLDDALFTIPGPDTPHGNQIRRIRSRRS